VKEQLIGFVSRHGETALNKNKCYRSWLDVPLDSNGLKQADMAADFLKKYPLKNVICSPLLRAFITADKAAAFHKLSVYQHRGLFPWRLGVFSGKAKEDCQDALRLFVQNPDVSIPDGESLQDFEDRQFAFWKEALKGARKTGLTLFVCHTSNIVSLINFTEEGDQMEPENLDTVEPGGIAAIYWNGKNHRIEPIFGGEKPAVFGGS